MKKHLKAVLSVLLAFVLFASSIPTGAIDAFAEGKLSSKVTYEEDGTAIVTLEAGDFYNAVRYTTDGSVPTNKSKLYVMPIEITEKTLIRVAEFDGDKKVKGIKLTVAPKDADSVSKETQSTSNASTANGKTGKITFDVTQLGGKASVELFCETPGVEIRYTTDGSKPTQESALYTGKLVFTEKTTICARAYKEGYKTTTTYSKTVKISSDNSYAASVDSSGNIIQPTTTVQSEDVSYGNFPKIGEVTFKIDVKNGKAHVRMYCATDGAQIRYTTDGTKPNGQSTVYEGEIVLEKNTTIRARAYKSYYLTAATYNQKVIVKPSATDVVKEEVKNEAKPETSNKDKYESDENDPEIGKVKISVKHYGNKAYVSLSCATDGAEIRFTTDGSKPNENSKLYTDEFIVLKNLKVRARAYKSGYQTNQTYSKTIEIDGSEDTEKQITSKPEKEPEEEPEEEKTTSFVTEDEEPVTTDEKINHKITYMDDIQRSYVTLNKKKNGNTIRYTTDGSTPSKNSKKYTQRVAFNEPGVLRAREYNSEGVCVATLKINVKVRCAKVEYAAIDIATGTRTITMSSETEGATIYYTTDGTVPNPDYSSVYSYPLVLGQEADINAIAVKDGYKNSKVSWDIAGAIELDIPDFDFDNPIYAEAAAAVNSIRKQNGQKAIVLDEKMTLAACVRAKELTVYMDHARPDGTSYATAMIKRGVDFDYSCEQYAYNYETPVEFVNAITKNPDDLKYFLGMGFTPEKMGIGYYKKGQAEYWVLLIAAKA